MKDKSFILVRHSYDDHSYIDGKNNTDLTSDGIKIAQEASERIYPLIDSSKILFRHSTKVRAQQTAEIIADYFLKHNIECKIVPDDGLTELYQGHLTFGEMPHIDRVNFLQSCWDDFETCRKSGDLNHHFGQNKSKKIVLTPGESHNEWATRIAQGFLHTIDDLKKGEYQPIDISHRGSIFVIQKLLQLINDEIQIDEVEKYETTWMNYCTEYKLYLPDLDRADEVVSKYIRTRS